jgi:hypothetical protein
MRQSTALPAYSLIHPERKLRARSSLQASHARAGVMRLPRAPLRKMLSTAALVSSTPVWALADRMIDPSMRSGVTAEQGLGGQVSAQRAVLDTATEELQQRLADLRVGRVGRLWPEVGEGGDVLAAGGDQAAGDPGDRLSDRDRVGPGLADAVLDLAGRAVGEGTQQRLAAPAAIALAWAIGPGPVVVIPGASSIGQLEANVAAADIVLRADEQQALTAAASEVRQGRVGISN